MSKKVKVIPVTRILIQILQVDRLDHIRHRMYLANLVKVLLAAPTVKAMMGSNLLNKVLAYSQISR
jgi:hypothetical protein